MFSKATVFVLAAAAHSALAKLYITAPVGSTTWAVGTDVTCQWEDDGTSPSLSETGVSSLGIYTGNSISQILLQQVGTLDVSVNNSITFKINGDIGPNNQAVYFMRFTSQSLMNTKTPTYPEQAFSAMFSVSGSTGTFNSTVAAEVAAASGGLVGATPSGTSSTTAVLKASNTVKPTATAQASVANSDAASSAFTCFYLPRASVLVLTTVLSVVFA